MAAWKYDSRVRMRRTLSGKQSCKRMRDVGPATGVTPVACEITTEGVRPAAVSGARILDHRRSLVCDKFSPAHTRDRPCLFELKKQPHNRFGSRPKGAACGIYLNEATLSPQGRN